MTNAHLTHLVFSARIWLRSTTTVALLPIFCGAKYDSRKQASPRWYTIPNTIFPPHLRTWLDWRNTWENWNIMALLLAGTFIPFNKRKLCSSSQLSFLFIKVRLESLCLGFFRNNCKTDKTSTLFAFYSSKNLCQISECCNLIIPDIMLIFQWLLLLHSPGLYFIRYSSADTHVVFYTVNPVLLFSFSAMMGTVWKLILMTLASTTKDYSSYCPKFSRKEIKNSCTTKKRWAAMAFLEIRRYIKDKNSWKWLAAQKRFAGLAKINESECRNSSSSGGGRGLCCRRPPSLSLWLKSWKKTKERPTKIRKD